MATLSHRAPVEDLIRRGGGGSDATVCIRPERPLVAAADTFLDEVETAMLQGWKRRPIPAGLREHLAELAGLADFQAPLPRTWYEAHGYVLALQESPAPTAVSPTAAATGADRSGLAALRFAFGWELRDGCWWKPCRYCGQSWPATAEHWYVSHGKPRHHRPCWRVQMRRRPAVALPEAA